MISSEELSRVVASLEHFVFTAQNVTVLSCIAMLCCATDLHICMRVYHLRWLVGLTGRTFS